VMYKSGRGLPKRMQVHRGTQAQTTRTYGLLHPRSTSASAPSEPQPTLSPYHAILTSNLDSFLHFHRRGTQKFRHAGQSVFPPPAPQLSVPERWGVRGLKTSALASLKVSRYEAGEMGFRYPAKSTSWNERQPTYDGGTDDRRRS